MAQMQYSKSTLKWLLDTTNVTKGVECQQYINSQDKALASGQQFNDAPDPQQYHLFLPITHSSLHPSFHKPLTVEHSSCPSFIQAPECIWGLRSRPSSESFGLCCVHRLQILLHPNIHRNKHLSPTPWKRPILETHRSESVCCANQYALKRDKAYVQNSQTTTPKVIKVTMTTESCANLLIYLWA